MKMTIKTAGERYLSEQEFLNKCRSYKPLSVICKEWGIKINRPLLKKLEVEPDGNDRYGVFQMGSLTKKLSQILDAIKEQQKRAIDEINSIFDFLDKNGSATNLVDVPDVRRFLMVMLTESFNKTIRELRATVDIPTDGFRSEKELNCWAEKRGLPTQNGIEIEIGSHDVISTHQEARSIFNALSKLKDDFGLGDFQTLYSYFFYDLNVPRKVLMCFTIPLTMAATATIMTRKQYYKLIRGDWYDRAAAAKKFPIWELPGENDEGKVYPTREEWLKTTITPDTFYIHIAVPRIGFRQKDLETFLKQHGKNIFQEYEAFYTSHELKPNFRDNWLIYFLTHKWGIKRERAAEFIGITPHGGSETFRRKMKALMKAQERFQNELAVLESDI